MCGIVCIFTSAQKSASETRATAVRLAERIRHRGPDWSGIYCFYDKETDKSATLAHERLSIVDPASGAQPLKTPDESIVLAVNGEIYNHEKLRAHYGPKSARPFDFRTKSDCEVILPLYQEHGPTAKMVNALDGMFAWVLWDEKKKTYIAARDHMGICPLYYGRLEGGGMIFASEMKAFIDKDGLLEGVTSFSFFPPGHFYDSVSDKFIPWYQPSWWVYDAQKLPSNKLDYTVLRQKFTDAVEKCMMSDVPWGVLLSGGLDSSLVASCAVRLLKGRDPKTLHTFSVGLQNSPDLAKAQDVADFLGTTHHSLVFTIEEGQDAIESVIRTLETYDVTTIRASTPMYLMARKIKAFGIKMVISGEGSDEALAGYLYFHKAPNSSELHAETIDKLKNLHYFDCLRANKSMSAWGVEPRVPFLDKEFLDYVMTLDPEVKMCKERPEDPKRGKVEKFILRKAFDTPKKPFLPESVLWRQKEQFSDGVGYGWIDSLRERAQEIVSNEMLANAAATFPHNTPRTHEAYWYRMIFETAFREPTENGFARQTVMGGPSVACSTGRAIEWDIKFKELAEQAGGECSGRSVGVHEASYGESGVKIAKGLEKAAVAAVVASPSKRAAETAASPSKRPKRG